MYSRGQRDEWTTGKTFNVSTKIEQGGTRTPVSFTNNDHDFFSSSLTGMHSILMGAGTGMLLVGDRVILPHTALSALDRYINPGDPLTLHLSVRTQLPAAQNLHTPRSSQQDEAQQQYHARTHAHTPRAGVAPLGGTNLAASHIMLTCCYLSFPNTLH